MRLEGSRHLGGELGHGLGALGDGVGELTGEDEAHGGLDLPGGDGGLLVVAGELGSLGGDLLEDVVDEGVLVDIALEEMPVSGCTCLRTL